MSGRKLYNTTNDYRAEVESLKPIIIKTAEQTLVDYSILDVTVDYIAEILIPIIGSIKVASDPEQEASKLLGTFYEFVEMPTYPGEPVYSFITTNLVVELLDSTSQRQSYNYKITPWDIAKTIETDPELTAVFKNQNSSNLMVDVSVGGNNFVHPLTFEQAYGIVLFSEMVPGAYTISMYGTPLKWDDVSNRFDNNDGHAYELTSGDGRYYFDTEDFMQGFMTGAMWTGVDVKQYVTALNKIEEDGSLTPINL